MRTRFFSERGDTIRVLTFNKSVENLVVGLLRGDGVVLAPRSD
jgi:hypothetical protein